MTPPALVAYREKHVIQVSREWDEDMGRFTPVCAHDSIRIYTVRGGWRHDVSEVRGLAAIERGEPLRW